MYFNFFKGNLYSPPMRLSMVLIARLMAQTNAVILFLLLCL